MLSTGYYYIATIGALFCATVALLIGCAGCGCGKKKKGKRTKSVRQLSNPSSVKPTTAPDKPASTAYQIEPVTDAPQTAAEAPQTATDFTETSIETDDERTKLKKEPVPSRIRKNTSEKAETHSTTGRTHAEISGKGSSSRGRKEDTKNAKGKADDKCKKEPGGSSNEEVQCNKKKG